MRSVIVQPVNILAFLNPGRLVKVRDGAEDWGWGAVVNFQKLPLGKLPITSVVGKCRLVWMCCCCSPNHGVKEARIALLCTG